MVNRLPFIYAIAVPIAIIALAVVTTVRDRNLEKRNKHAIIVLASSQCPQNEVFRQAALKSAKSDAEVERINAFFHQFNAPINHALRILGAKPCKGG